ncbi:unnamed protein product [Rotaria sp. Silwood1]|nr:unnamed protein product [Rotaria sp. Silwood1]CAF1264290.1 unnamed protein product [Rotaria sp. Silwood1]
MLLHVLVVLTSIIITINARTLPEPIPLTEQPSVDKQKLVQNPADQQAAIVSRMRKLESFTAINNARCVQFRPSVSTDVYYITIRNGAGCYSYVGQNTEMTGERTVSLSYPGCFDDGRTMHELIHTLVNSGRWSTTGALAIARANHTSTLLLNGRVITVGGNINGNTVELYNATTQIWSAGPSMTDARILHTATLLPDGRLIITGGYYNKFLKTVEIYNPTTNTWSTVSSMNTARYGHQAIYLPAPSNKLLVMGGYGNNSVMLQSCELYDFGTNTWTYTNSMIEKRVYFTATYLPSLSKVLAIGGTGTLYGSAEMFTISSSQWVRSANTMPNDRYFHTATLIPATGQVLIVGGYDNPERTYIFNPTNNSFTIAASMGQGRREISATLLPSGLILVAGGSFNSSSLYRTAEVYDYRLNIWRPVASMSVARSLHTAVLFNASSQTPVVLITGGQIGNSVSTSNCELFNVNG